LTGQDRPARLPTVQRAIDEHTELVLGEPRPTPLLGIDATRLGRVRWVRAGGGRWVRTEPWETRFVDLRCPRRDGGQGRLVLQRQLLDRW
jgi:hypothetical protein